VAREMAPAPTHLWARRRPAEARVRSLQGQRSGTHARGLTRLRPARRCPRPMACRCERRQSHPCIATVDTSGPARSLPAIGRRRRPSHLCVTGRCRCANDTVGNVCLC
jgi:hypothetical protein